ncbi:hypothetical protein [Halobacillus naozhouensis]|uniref:Tumour necrosis factor receptor superfamily member 19 n=1 Tax=Halobacillus naozhouensis TaxID=554880 RepID=A0ABY8J2D4_9BACI|nr:hypothetical protein [Halobacillus naozhouensis]WFT76525.1 hypothetical protein P9989_09245 [Halobacillus naozhouensis]
MNAIIAILMIVAPALFLISWGKSGYDWGTTEEDRKNGEKEHT